MKKPSISVFFPCYNDSKSIGTLVLKAHRLLEKVARVYEIIVVNDGSKDDSLAVLQSLKKKVRKLKIVNHQKNRGYGGALASGIASARYDLVFYTDGDGQYDVMELEILLKCLTPDIDVVNGIKMDRQDNSLRIFLGNAYKSAIRNIFNLPIFDVDCDFRLIRRKFLKGVKLKYRSAIVCTELVKKLQKNHARFREVSVHHFPRVYGHSQFFKIWPITLTIIELVSLILNSVRHHLIKKQSQAVRNSR